MKWLILTLFILGGLCEVFAWWGARQDRRKHESADVAMGNWIPAWIGFVIWGIDLVVTLVWLVVRG